MTNLKGDGCLSDFNVIISLELKHNQNMYRKQARMFPDEGGTEKVSQYDRNVGSYCYGWTHLFKICIKCGLIKAVI